MVEGESCMHVHVFNIITWSTANHKVHMLYTIHFMCSLYTDDENPPVSILHEVLLTANTSWLVHYTSKVQIHIGQLHSCTYRTVEHIYIYWTVGHIGWQIHIGQLSESQHCFHGTYIFSH